MITVAAFLSIAQ